MYRFRWNHFAARSRLMAISVRRWLMRRPQMVMLAPPLFDLRSIVCWRWLWSLLMMALLPLLLPQRLPLSPTMKICMWASLYSCGPADEKTNWMTANTVNTFVWWWRVCVRERERVAGREKARRRPESHLSHHTASNMQMANKAYSLSHSDRQCLSYVYHRCSPHPSKLKANGYEMYLVRRFSGWCGKCRRLTGRYDQFIFVYRCSTCFSIRRWWCPFDRCTSTGFICHRCCGRWRWGGGRRSFIRLMLAQQIGRFFFLRFRLQVTFLCTNFAVQLAGFARLTFPLCIRDAVCTCTCVC